MCNTKVIFRLIVGVALFFILGLTFFPQFKGALLALAPFAFILLFCPLIMVAGMYFMGKGMKADDSMKDNKNIITNKEKDHE